MLKLKVRVLIVVAKAAFVAGWPLLLIWKICAIGSSGFIKVANGCVRLHKLLNDFGDSLLDKAVEMLRNG